MINFDGIYKRNVIKCIFDITQLMTAAKRQAGTDREGDEKYEYNFTLSICQYKCAAHLQNSCEISGFPAEIVIDVTLLGVRTTQINMRSIGRHKCY